jgi:ganglioside-induced differentiation-associated protein 1
MLLFTGRNSICTQKVLITLFEKGLTWDTKRVDLFRNEQYDPEYLKYNPKGVVPTLVHNNKAIVESTLICEYLDETFPTPSLVPTSSYERSQMRLWSKQIDEGIFEATREISFSAMFRDKLRTMTDGAISASTMLATRHAARAFAPPTNSARIRPTCFMPSRRSKKCSA